MTHSTWLTSPVRFCLQNRLVVVFITALLLGWGLLVAPFDWSLGGVPRSPVPVDALPDMGENQQIIFTRWSGRSPKDVEDQITYPLTAALMGLPKLKTVRSYSYFGFSTIYLIFDDSAPFYGSRSRVLEKLNSLPSKTLPAGVKPALGPDATGLGQIFWYTLEGRDKQGKATGGWDLHELRKIQDWYVRYGLQAVSGVAEVASVGGFVQEYQVNVDPARLRQYKLSLPALVKALRETNRETGARTIEINKVEYVIRARGYVKKLADLENTVLLARKGASILVKDVATVTLGPATRRGALDKSGAEVVGGVVVSRYGANPLDVLKRVRKRIQELSVGLPSKTLKDGRISKVTIVPFYDRTRLIKDTLATLEEAISLEIIVTILVVLVMLMHLRSSLLIAGTLPLAVLFCFIAMKLLKVDANIVALSGIAIAIGTMVDMGVVLSENILQHLERSAPDENRLEIVLNATSEVGGAIVTAVSTTVLSFLPVFTLQASEGKLFRPLAWTKTFALLSSLLVALFLLPVLAHMFLGREQQREQAPFDWRLALYWGLQLGLGGMWLVGFWQGWLRSPWGWFALIVTLTLLLSLKALLYHSRKLAFRLWGYWWAIAASLGLMLWVRSSIRLTWLWMLVWSLLLLVMFAARSFWKVEGVSSQLPVLPLAPLRPWLSMAVLVSGGLGLALFWKGWVGGFVLGIALMFFLERLLPEWWLLWWRRLSSALVVAIVGVALTLFWQPLGQSPGILANLSFVGLSVGGLLLLFWLFQRSYANLLRLFLRHKGWFLAAPVALVLLGGTIWLGFDKAWSWMPAVAERTGLVTSKQIRSSRFWVKARHSWFPGLKKEFMPQLDEGSFLVMPTTMPHASIGECLDAMQKLDKAIRLVPEVSQVVGKLGRVESALDPAPISMFEIVVHIHPKYRRDRKGRKIRVWRKHLRTTKDIWDEIVKVAKVPGTTSAPFLQPISARLVMLQSGMRAPMGLKIKGPDLKTIEKVALQVEKYLKKVPQISPATVVADRVVGKPYLEFHINRKAIARYGLTIAAVQRSIQMAIGGRQVTTTIEGRERYAVVVRYKREMRNNLNSLRRVLVTTPNNTPIPILQLGSLRYVRGPQVIKSEDSFPVAYVVFDRKSGAGEVQTVQAAQRFLKQKLKSGEWKLPAGVSYNFAGSFLQQQRAEKRLWIVLPVSLLLIFLLLYLQFRTTSTALFIFGGILVAWSGGFLVLWLYNQPWFLDISFWGLSLRDVFQVRPYAMSVAVWVGFLALFGIATDDGVVMATYLDQEFQRQPPSTLEQVRELVVQAGQRRVRPCLMTTATTLLALLPILTSSGRGADLMIPMALPSFGGMLVELLTLFVVPVLYGWREERKLRARWAETTQHEADTSELELLTAQEAV
jgi:Cu(I)/Ag(I) efflux system membrane protein CusA/SilA